MNDVKIVCVRTEDADSQMAKGTTEMACSSCQKPVIVSPSSMTQFQLGGTEIICNKCVLGVVENHNKIIPMLAPGAMEEFLELLKEEQAEERQVPVGDFRDLQPGDEVTRMLAGVVPHKVIVEKVEDGLIYMKGGWIFDQLTGVEEDEELGFGVKYNYTGSFLVRTNE